MDLLREFCTESFSLIPKAIAAGARRIEFCGDLSVGGITPATEDIRNAVCCAHSRGAAVMVMVRPRGGSFVYSDTERETMLETISTARSLQADGVVFGCLREDEHGQLTLDKELTKALVDAAKEATTSAAPPLQVTFHMAFDELEPDAQLEAVDALAAMGVERILTHGGPLCTPIAGNIEHLRKLVGHANGRLVIMPGGGITWENAKQVADLLGVHEVHGTKIVKLP